jgi:hypothetical protein
LRPVGELLGCPSIAHRAHAGAVDGLHGGLCGGNGSVPLGG